MKNKHDEIKSKTESASVMRMDKRLVILTLLAVSLLAIIAVWHFLAPETADVVSLGDALQKSGVQGAVVFLMGGMLVTSVGFPRQLIAFIAGLAYGVTLGLFLSLAAALMGCALTALASRRWLAGFVKSHYPNAVSTLDACVQKNPFLKVIVLRLQPLGTNLLSNVCVGFTRMPLKIYFAASAIGYIPQMLVFILLGAGVRVGSSTQLGVGVVLLVVSVLIGILLYQKEFDIN